MAPKLKVLATGAYEHSLTLISAMFERDEGCRVQLDFGNARAVAAKVSSHSDADVVMTSLQGMEELQASGLIHADTRISVGNMRLGAAVARSAHKPDVSSADPLRATLLSAPSIAYIDPNGGGTTGPHFTKLIQILDIADKVKDKTRLCASGRDVVRMITAGDAVIGLTQASELIGIPALDFVGFLPDELQLITTYQAAMTATCTSEAEAKRFLAYLSGPKAAEQLLKSGWRLVA